MTLFTCESKYKHSLHVYLKQSTITVFGQLGVTLLLFWLKCLPKEPQKKGVTCYYTELQAEKQPLHTHQQIHLKQSNINVATVSWQSAQHILLILLHTLFPLKCPRIFEQTLKGAACACSYVN